MLITKSEFQNIIKNVPPIHIELKWINGEGSVQLEDEEFSSGLALVFFSGTVTASRTSDDGDQTTAPSYTQGDYNLDITDVNAFIEDIGEVICFTEEQTNELIKAITESFVE